MIQKSTLFKLNAFCKANEIEYIITGTMALDLLGMPIAHIPQDIDIKVFHLTEEQKAKLNELQLLSGLAPGNENYWGKCYNFLVDSVKVNAIVDNADHDLINAQSIIVKLFDDTHNYPAIIPVQKVGFALAAKAQLNRPKDKNYMLKLISNIASL